MNYGLLLATVHLAAGGLILILGLVLLREHARSAINRVVASMLFFAGLGTTLGSSEFLLPQINPKLGERGTDLVMELSFLWEFFFPLLLLFALSFPSPHRVLRRVPLMRLLIFLPYIGHTLLVGTRAIVGETFGIPSGDDVGVGWALARVVVEGLYALHRTLYSLVNIAYVTAAVLVIRAGIHRSEREQLRQQMGSVAWGMAACGVFYVVSTPIAGLVLPDLNDTVRHTALLVALVTGCGAIAYAMVRYRFLEASLIARRAILYAVSTALVVGLYLTAVNQLDELIKRITGVETPVFQGFMLVVSLILYQPLLAKLEELLESALLRDRTDYRTAVRELSESILTTLEPRDLGRIVVDVLYGCLLTDRVLFVRYASGDEAPRDPESRGMIIDDSLLADLPRRSETEGLEPLTPVDVGDETLFLLPCQHKEEVLGAVLIGPKLTGRRYSGEDRTLLSSMGNQLTTALKSAELHHAAMRRAELERDIDTARRIQRAFLPGRFPDRPEIDIFGCNIPSREVGGDYYDVLEQDDSVVFAVADVSGKGVPAALLASMVQASLRTQATSETRVGMIMEGVNRLICSTTSPDQFATLFLARVELPSLRLTYANAGHNFPILLHTDGSATLLDHSDLIVGILPATPYVEVSLDLSPGDRLILFTDGVSEARLNGLAGRRGEFLGDDGFLELLRKTDRNDTASALVEGVRRELDAMVDKDFEADDITILAVRVPEAVRQPIGAPAI